MQKIENLTPLQTGLILFCPDFSNLYFVAEQTQCLLIPPPSPAFFLQPLPIQQEQVSLSDRSATSNNVVQRKPQSRGQTQFSFQPRSQGKKCFNLRNFKNLSKSKNFLTNLSRCLKEYLKENRLDREEPFHSFNKSHHKTMSQFSQFLKALSEEQLKVVLNFFQGKVLKYMLTSHVQLRNVKQYIRMLPTLIYGLKSREIPCLSSLKQVLDLHYPTL